MQAAAHRMSAVIEKMIAQRNPAFMVSFYSLTVIVASDYTLRVRGVAQLAAHRVWDAGAGGSSPPTPTALYICQRFSHPGMIKSALTVCFATHPDWLLKSHFFGGISLNMIKVDYNQYKQFSNDYSKN